MSVPICPLQLFRHLLASKPKRHDGKTNDCAVISWTRARKCSCVMAHANRGRSKRWRARSCTLVKDRNVSWYRNPTSNGEKRRACSYHKVKTQWGGDGLCSDLLESKNWRACWYVLHRSAAWCLWWSPNADQFAKTDDCATLATENRNGPHHDKSSRACHPKQTNLLWVLHKWLTQNLEKLTSVLAVRS